MLDQDRIMEILRLEF